MHQQSLCGMVVGVGLLYGMQFACGLVVSMHVGAAAAKDRRCMCEVSCTAAAAGVLHVYVSHFQ